ncbi:MAG: 3-phosphoshikimate 1-carboxyvinyltransferase [Candidatus Diapherotrites archaeon]
MSIEIRPAEKLDAIVSAPPSKAYTLRALFVAALARGKSALHNCLLAEDQLHAINALRALGVKIEINGKEATVFGSGGEISAPEKEIFVGNSGVTSRFLASVAALAKNGSVTVSGDKRMQQRPIKELLEALKKLGVKAESVKKNGCPPYRIFGSGLIGGKTSLRGEESSQYLSSLLLAAPFAKKNVSVKVNGKLASKPYIELTIGVMKDFGVKVGNNGYREFLVKAGQRYKARDYAVEGDYSSASYFFAAAAISGGSVRVENLNPKSAQGDRKFLEILKKMGCMVKKERGFVEVSGPKKGKLKAVNVEMAGMPDVAMTLAVVAAFAKGKTKIKNIGNLRLKESDRITATVNELKRIGAKARELKDGIEITGGAQALHGAEIETYNDHRIAMAFAVAGLRVKGVKIRNPECVNKSFPEFFSVLESLGRIKNIALIGYRGTGKGKIGELLAEKLKMDFVDTDEMIVEMSGMAVPEIFRDKGERGFREIEKEIVEEASEMQGTVIATGGGVVEMPENIENLKKNAVIILLEASAEKTLERIKGDKNRPRLTDKDELEEIKFMKEKRRKSYESAADFTVDTTDTSIPKDVKRIIGWLKRKGIVKKAVK